MKTEKTSRNWLRIIGLGGPEGRTWVETFQRSGTDEMIQSTHEALILLRAGKLDEGAAILDQVAAFCQFNEGDDAPTSILHLLRRHYYSVAAYRHYCFGDFSSAWASLDRAEHSLRTVVANSFLVVLAESYIDFTIQKARIARSLRNWPLMWRCLWKARDMAENHVPLCSPDPERAIFCSTICDRLSSFELDEEEVCAWREMMDEDVRRSLIERLVREVYTIPGFVIDY